MTVLSIAATVLRSVLEWVGFWTAVAIPLGYLYLFYNGLTGPELMVLGKLFGLHIVAFVVGRGYNLGAGQDRPSSYRDQNRTT